MYYFKHLLVKICKSPIYPSFVIYTRVLSWRLGAGKERAWVLRVQTLMRVALHFSCRFLLVLKPWRLQMHDLVY